jgi:uncharacterized protein YdeI (YjbR/CyaY-like superfamily)
MLQVMAGKAIRTLELATRRAWRRWLEQHHGSEPEIWLVFHKQHTGGPAIDYEAAVEEALCFGWVDSLIRRLDDARYARKFTPRKPGSRWSTLNRRRWADLEQRGLLAPAGRERGPTDASPSGDAPHRRVATLPAYIEQRLRRNARAWAFFQALAPSYRRAYVGWIHAPRGGRRTPRGGPQARHQVGP